MYGNTVQLYWSFWIDPELFKGNLKLRSVPRKIEQKAFMKSFAWEDVCRKYIKEYCDKNMDAPRRIMLENTNNLF